MEKNLFQAYPSNMQNIFDLGKVPYCVADQVPYSVQQRLVLYALVFLDAIRVIVLSIPWLLLDAFNMVIPRSRKSVKGQTALITGGGNGIGREIALRLAKEECNIAIADIDFAAAQKTVAELRKMNIVAFAYQVDVADHKQVIQLQVDIQRDLGEALDILINNAGIMSLISLREGSVEELDRILRINLNSHFYTIRTFLPGMIKNRRGHIVGMSSMAGIHPTPQLILYSAAKFGIQGLLQSLQEEMRHEGYGDIHCTTVHPYFVSTRQDVMDAVTLRFPPVTPERTADETINAMLRNESIATVPGYLIYLVKMMQLLPVRCQQLCRDYILQEQTSRAIWYNENAPSLRNVM